MGQMVRPSVYWIGCTEVDFDEVRRYLRDSGNEEFNLDIDAALEAGVPASMILCSMYAKLCYKSLTLGQNANVTRVRSIEDNLKGCFAQGHGSVFEHVNLNFVIRDCSRVFTHELVRHRVGTAFSQTSGRYVRGDSVDLVMDPILSPVQDEIQLMLYDLEKRYKDLCDRMGLNGADACYENAKAALGDSATQGALEHVRDVAERRAFLCKDFGYKKKLTSALRRILPNGQSNEMGFSVNIRALRHLVQLRTSRFAEWEIRDVFEQIYLLVKAKLPLIFCDASEEVVDGVIEVKGMTLQPYDVESK